MIDNRKKSTIVARVTKEEKDKINKKAKALSKSESKYILDCCMAGLERKSDKQKKMIGVSVVLQEDVNQLRYLIQESGVSGTAKSKIEELVLKIGGDIYAYFNEYGKIKS